jgi:hypothetical protein
MSALARFAIAFLSGIILGIVSLAVVLALFLAFCGTGECGDVGGTYAAFAAILLFGAFLTVPAGWFIAHRLLARRFPNPLGETDGPS